MSERITEAELREIEKAVEEAERLGGYDHGVDPRDLVAEVRRQRALIVALELVEVPFAGRFLTDIPSLRALADEARAIREEQGRG